MNKTFTYCLNILLTAVLLVSCTFKEKPKLPPLNETYKSDDKNPFGSYIAYNDFKKLFQYRYVDVNKKPFADAWLDMQEYSTNTKYSLYIIITRNLMVSYNESEALLSFVKEGNDLFIAADYIDDYFLKKINCRQQRDLEIASETEGSMKITSVSLQRDFADNNTLYQYFYYPFLNSFYDFDSLHTKVLGLNETGKANYIVVFFGKGRLYLHAAPRTFSNYFLLTQHNYLYLENILKYLRPEPKNIFWDEYFKGKMINRKTRNQNFDDQKNEADNFSSLSVINKNPPLLWAFWLCISLIIIYVIFNIKRKQRIIDEKKPNVNTTLAFTETIGRLYLQKKNNKRIAEKMITYFYEYIRSRFFLNTSQVNPEFISSLSGKSGIEITATEKLFGAINEVQSKKEITDAELLSLNEQVESFYKKRIDGRKIIYRTH